MLNTLKFLGCYIEKENTNFTVLNNVSFTFHICVLALARARVSHTLPRSST